MVTTSATNSVARPVLKIRKYQAKDHGDVKRIFGEGIYEHIPNGIKLGLRSPKVLAYLAVAFVWGYQYSIYLAISALGLAIGLQALSVYLCYELYRR